MLNKTQSISARLSANDYTYLMSIDRNGAVTQSEKVRELIAIAREAVGPQSYARSYISSAEALLPLIARYKDQGDRSLLVEALLDMMVEMSASIQACRDEPLLALALEARALPAIDAFLEKLLLLSRQRNPRLVRGDVADTIKARIDDLMTVE
jgi:hypothetical protein